jgi:hypothetical protein
MRMDQLPAWQLFQQTKEWGGDWAVVAYHCWLAGLDDEAEYADRRARGLPVDGNPTCPEPPPACPECGGTEGSHKRWCHAIVRKLRRG